MHISFWCDYTIKNLLFYGFNTTSVIVFIVTCFGFLGVALFFEYIKMLQAKVRQTRLMMTQKQFHIICPSESDTLLTNNPEPSTSSASPAPPQPETLILTRKHRILHFVNDMSLWLCQNILGYMLMLTVMIYNTYLVIAIVVGSAIGYFLFGPALMKINIENCRAMRSNFCMSDCGEPDKAALLGPDNVNEIRSDGTTPVPVCHTISETITETNEEVQT